MRTIAARSIARLSALRTRTSSKGGVVAAEHPATRHAAAHHAAERPAQHAAAPDVACRTRSPCCHLPLTWPEVAGLLDRGSAAHAVTNLDAEDLHSLTRNVAQDEAFEQPQAHLQPLGFARLGLDRSVPNQTLLIQSAPGFCLTVALGDDAQRGRNRPDDESQIVRTVFKCTTHTGRCGRSPAHALNLTARRESFRAQGTP